MQGNRLRNTNSFQRSRSQSSQQYATHDVNFQYINEFRSKTIDRSNKNRLTHVRTKISILHQFAWRKLSSRDPKLPKFMAHVSTKRYSPNKIRLRTVARRYLHDLRLSSWEFLEVLWWWIPTSPFGDYFGHKGNPSIAFAQNREISRSAISQTKEFRWRAIKKQNIWWYRPGSVTRGTGARRTERVRGKYNFSSFRGSLSEMISSFFTRFRAEVYK